jgi:proteasome lid subunit RPN8/RPN11
VGLQISQVLLQQIIDHADRSYPEECCGLLLGQIDRTEGLDQDSEQEVEQKTVLEIWQTPNAWSAEVAEAIADWMSPLDSQTDALPHDTSDSDRRDRYWIDPQEMLAAQRYVRDRHWEIVGIYHSHPDHAAVPSECDRRLAWPRYAYLILSVQQGKTQNYGVWSLDPHHLFQAESVQIA